MSERQGGWFQEACDGVIDAAEAKEEPRGFDTQEVSGGLNQNNSGGPELMGGSGRRQGDDGR